MGYNNNFVTTFIVVALFVIPVLIVVLDCMKVMQSIADNDK